VIEPAVRTIRTADGHELSGRFFRPRGAASLWEPCLLPALTLPAFDSGTN
jgi:hypothetical protein